MVGQVSPAKAALVGPPRSRWSGPSTCAGSATGSATSAPRSRSYVESKGYSVVRQFVGHGIGTRMHEEPGVPNFGEAGRGYRLKRGLVIAVEPMVNAGAPDVELLDDGWTAVTRDRSMSAHFEHTIAITGRRPLGPLSARPEPGDPAHP